MRILNDNEMLEVNGGAKISVGLVGLITGVVAFVLGVIDGIANPQKCNSR